MIRWLVQSIDDHPDLARGMPPDGLLHTDEAALLATLKIEKRRRDWLLGRWTAKRLLQSALAEDRGEVMALDHLLIAADADGAPYAARAGSDGLPVRLPYSLSISHSGGHSFCALHETAGPSGARLAVGADIEMNEARSERFVADYFAPTEASMVAAAAPAEQARLVTTIWSAKEAVLKALREGLRLNTRQIVCLPHPARAAGWTPFDISFSPDLQSHYAGVWSGWWRHGPGSAAAILTLAVWEQPAE